MTKALMTTTVTIRRRAKALSAILTIPLVILALSACTSVGPTGADGSPSASPSTSKLSFDEWQVANARCMRDHGIDVPDPSSEGAGSLPSADEAGSGAMVEATKKCAAKLGDMPLPPGGDKTESQTQEDMLTMAKCLRENGLDVQDPLPGEAFGLPAGASDAVLEKCGIATSPVTK